MKGSLMNPAVLVGDGWADVLAPVADTIAQLGDRLRAEQAAGRRFGPAGDRVFAALGMPLASVRVVIVGQDPYPTPGHAIGLAFAVERGVRPLPPSLVNLLTEYETDLALPRPTHGDLSAWVAQGVLLLNRVLTVGHGEPGSHRGWGWEQAQLQSGLLRFHRKLFHWSPRENFIMKRRDALARSQILNCSTKIAKWVWAQPFKSSVEHR